MLDDALVGVVWVVDAVDEEVEEFEDSELLMIAKQSYGSSEFRTRKMIFNSRREYSIFVGRTRRGVGILYLFWHSVVLESE